jgi:hypothetical protein
MHRKVAAALVAALALTLASCGGSEESLTRAQLVSRIEQACRDGQAESQRQMRASRGGGTSTFISAVLAGQKQEHDAIDNFKVPDAAKADYESFKEGVKARVEAIERVVSAGRANFQSAMRAAQPQAEAAARRVEAAARSLGIQGCQ